MPSCYLIHFETPYRHARHYLGFATFVDLRIARHAQGNGARLMAAVTEAGIPWEVTRVWRYRATRDFERKLHKLKNSKKLCPKCCGRKAYKRMRLPTREGSTCHTTDANSSLS